MATSAQITAFIQEFGRLAVEECNHRIAQGKGFILPSVCIAQSALETGWGTSGLMVKANAYFGIKAGGSWTGAVYRADTWEVANGEAYNTTANFRAYSSKAESVADYFDLVTSLSRYSNAVSYGADSTQWLTPRATITAIWAGGYATDTLYVEKIMNTITARGLTAYDNRITGIDVPFTNIHFKYTLESLVQGKLTASDSGRAFTTEVVDNAIALAWTDAFVIPQDVTLTINLPSDDMEIYLARVLNDTIISDGTPLYNERKVTFSAGEYVSFYIMYSSEEETISPEGHGGAYVSFDSEAPFPEGEEINVSTIAYFIKI